MGVAASAALLLLYFFILSIANSFEHALEQFYTMWYLIGALVVLFGVQVGLYSYIKTLERRPAAVTAELAASGSVSGTSMVACCLHHVTDVLPVVGLSAFSVFLLQYQIAFMLLGVFSSLVGITMMLAIMQTHGLFETKSVFARVFRYDMVTLRNVTVMFAAIFVSAAFFISAFPPQTVMVATDKTPILTSVAASKFSNPKQTQAVNPIILDALVDEQAGVSIEVVPKPFVVGKPLSFEMRINTHTGSLDFDLVEVSYLEDDTGKRYKPLKWQGSPLGGHHRSGTLVFPALDRQPDKLKLVVADVYGVPERTFTWLLSASK
jgi:hypothetical protein